MMMMQQQLYINADLTSAMATQHQLCATCNVPKSRHIALVRPFAVMSLVSAINALTCRNYNSITSSQHNTLIIINCAEH
jgi:hypothetical protein